MHRLTRFFCLLPVYIVGFLVFLWATGALYFDLPVPALVRQDVSIIFPVGVILIWCFARGWRRIFAVLPILPVVAWWFTLQPKADRPWQPDVGRTAWAEVDGDVVTIHDVRNFEYHADGKSVPRWETRTVRLSRVTGIDLGVNYWGSPLMAHPITSFQFADAPPLCFSIETRREIGENYSAIGGFYRQYELIYIVADESDVIGVRTNHGEDIYLYRLNISPDRARKRFLEFIAALNSLHARPRWYNAATANCTTSIYTQRAASERTAWDWRILVNGYGDQMLYEQGTLCTGGLPFEELKKQALINDLAKAAGDSPDFSKQIRARLQTRP